MKRVRRPGLGVVVVPSFDILWRLRDQPAIKVTIERPSFLSLSGANVLGNWRRWWMKKLHLHSSSLYITLFSLISRSDAVMVFPRSKRDVIIFLVASCHKEPALFKFTKAQPSLCYESVSQAPSLTRQLPTRNVPLEPSSSRSKSKGQRSTPRPSM